MGLVGADFVPLGQEARRRPSSDFIRFVLTAQRTRFTDHQSIFTFLLPVLLLLYLYFGFSVGWGGNGLSCFFFPAFEWTLFRTTDYAYRKLARGRCNQRTGLLIATIACRAQQTRAVKISNKNNKLKLKLKT